MSKVARFTGKKTKDLRTQLSGVEILGNINQNLRALDKIDEELDNAVQDFDREVLDENGEVIRTETYRSTILDKETIAVYHTRQAGYKMKIDTSLKLLNKVLPDLRAIDQTGDIGNAADKAIKAFALAASEE